MIVRRLAPGDWEIFRDLRLEALRLVPAAYASTLADWEPLERDEWMRRLTVNTVFAAFHGDRPWGLLGLMPEGVIGMVYVRDEARRQGVARAMMHAALDAAHQQKMPEIRLNVSHGNDGAMTLYTNMGFRPTGQDATQTFMALTL